MTGLAMTPNEFRELALSLPETVEGEHMNYPDFRVGGKIFATLGPDETWGMVKLPADEQERLATGEPEMFEPFNGAWWRQGCIKVWLKPATLKTIQPALKAAWRHTAPQQLVKETD